MADPSSDPSASTPASDPDQPAPVGLAPVSPAIDAARRRWMADTLQFHLDPITPPLSNAPSATPTTLPPIPSFQLPDPAATFGASPPLVPPPTLLPVPTFTGAPAASADLPSPTLTREGVEVEAEGDRPGSDGTVQLFPSASMAVRTPWNGQPIGPDVRGPVTSAEVGVTIFQIGDDATHLQVGGTLEHGQDGLSEHATAELKFGLGPADVTIQGDVTKQGEEGKIMVGGTF